jgi:hypothetical protein
MLKEGAVSFVIAVAPCYTPHFMAKKKCQQYRFARNG